MFLRRNIERPCWKTLPAMFAYFRLTSLSERVLGTLRILLSLCPRKPSQFPINPWWESFPAKTFFLPQASVSDKMFSVQLSADDFFGPKPSPWNAAPVIWEVLKPPISTSALIPNPICMKGCIIQPLPSNLALQECLTVLQSSLPS